MLRRFRQTRATPVVAALYAFAMIMLGFAHQPIPLPHAPTVDLSAYALPDGTVPTLCSHSGDSDHGSPHDGAHLCEACALSAAAGLICAPPVAQHTADFVVLSRRTAPQAQFAPAVPPAPTSRGPPARLKRIA